MTPTWKCGHPRTPENTKLHGVRRVCKVCRLSLEARAQAKIRAERTAALHWCRANGNPHLGEG